MGTSRLGRRDCAEADDVDGAEEVGGLTTERKRSEGQLLPMDMQGRTTRFFLSGEPQKRLCMRLYVITGIAMESGGLGRRG